LTDIAFDIAEDNPKIAERVSSELYAALQKLGQNPGIGHYHDEFLTRKIPLLELL